MNGPLWLCPCGLVRMLLKMVNPEHPLRRGLMWQAALLTILKNVPAMLEVSALPHWCRWEGRFYPLALWEVGDSAGGV